VEHANTQIVRRLIVEEIEQLVAKAREGPGFIRAGEHAYRIMQAHPDSGLSGEQVVNQIVMEATAAGVAVEIGAPCPVAA
jgi:hypothetical protein